MTGVWWRQVKRFAHLYRLSEIVVSPSNRLADDTLQVRALRDTTVSALPHTSADLLHRGLGADLCVRAFVGACVRAVYLDLPRLYDTVERRQRRQG